MRNLGANMNKKSGFTLAELLMIMFLVGALVVLGVQVILNRQNNYKVVYYAAYKNLKMAAGELVATSPTGKVSYAFDENNNPTTFCQKLSNIFNVSAGASVCSNIYTFNPTAGLSSSSVTPNNSSLSLTNGQRLYISNTFVAPGANNYFNEQATLVLVDLNGKGAPNIIDTKSYTDTRTPDIVAFAITDSGVVIPMTPLADDNEHILANVQLCTFADGCSTDLTQNLIAEYKNIPIRKAISVSNTFPPSSTGTGTQYNNDTTYAFKVAHTVDARCAASNTTTFCRVLMQNPIMDGIGATL